MLLLHILLFLLKLIGIVLLVILGLIVLILAIILLTPIRYRIGASVSDNTGGRKGYVALSSD